MHTVREAILNKLKQSCIL